MLLFSLLQCQWDELLPEVLFLSNHKCNSGEKLTKCSLKLSPIIPH
ncbi:hypothetical protein DsansV1_C32g0221621 [Dioscorea sansibarensis]